MTGCQTCGWFGDRHDPVAHGEGGRIGEGLPKAPAQIHPGEWRITREDATNAGRTVLGLVSELPDGPYLGKRIDNDEPCICGTPFTCLADEHPDFGKDDTWDEADYRRDGDQALTALAASIREYRREGGQEGTE